MTGSRAGVLIVEDHRMVAEALATSLTPHFEVRGIVENGLKVVECVGAQPVDLVVLDLNLPGRSGVQVLEDLVRIPKAPFVLCLSMEAEHFWCEELRKRGARGFLPKTDCLSALSLAVQTVLSGGEWFSSHSPGAAVPSRLDRGIVISRRKVEILQAIAGGLTAKEIAGLLGIGQHTVEDYLQELRELLGTRNTAALVGAAIAHGFVSLLTATGVEYFVPKRPTAARTEPLGRSRRPTAG